jgi:hypothetical protein
MTSRYLEGHSLSENSREPYSKARLAKQDMDWLPFSRILSVGVWVPRYRCPDVERGSCGESLYAKIRGRVTSWCASPALQFSLTKLIPLKG